VKTEKINAVRVWKQLEDLAVPRLPLSLFDRAAYSHLLRHSRLEGKLDLRFSIIWLARGAGLSEFAARRAVRNLIAKGALRLTERNRDGHLVQVRLPEEIRSLCSTKAAAQAAERVPSADSFEKTDFLQSRALREMIHARERGRCFYCLSRLRRLLRCLDHVFPSARGGRNGYRNLVSCCADCNSKKGDRRVEDFLRWPCREGRLSSDELRGRFAALARLAAGKLPPVVPAKRGANQPRFPTPASAMRG